MRPAAEKRAHRAPPTHQSRVTSHRSRVQRVSGHAIPEPRMTVTAWLLILGGVVLPVLLLGAMGDGLLQFFFGLCTGLWC